MSKQLKNSSLTTRLFLEGIEVDLLDQIDVATTYSVGNIKNISGKSSPHTKSVTIPGTANNNQIFALLFDIKSTGSDAPVLTSDYTAMVSNTISGVTVTNIGLLGSSFIPPIAYNSEQQTFHDQINNTTWYADVSGNTDGCGYVVCTWNGIVVSCNRVTGEVSRYYFPAGLYAFTDILQMSFQPNYQAFSGNSGYTFDAKKRQRAYVIQDNQVVMSGYAKLINATTKNGATTYSIQITSDLAGLIAALANQRLEDLYTTIGPNINVDPTGQTPETIYLNTPYDHVFTVGNAENSWYQIFGEAMYGIYYPLIDYGNDDTVGQTNFYSSVLRPALQAKTYWDQIFAQAGFTYDSAFLNSEYFSHLIIPYKDGNITLIDKFEVVASTYSTSGITVVDGVTPVVPNNTEYIFNNDVLDTYFIYVQSTPGNSYPAYVAQFKGFYNINLSFTGNYTLTAYSDSAGKNLQTPDFNIFMVVEVFPASGGTIPYWSSVTNSVEADNSGLVIDQGIGTVLIGGANYFVGGAQVITSDDFIITFPQFGVYVQNANDTIRVRLAVTAPDSTSSLWYYEGGDYAVRYQGAGVINILNTVYPNTQPVLEFERSSILDSQWLRFKDFVPKSVKQIEYLSSIIRLFNLFPVQDPDQPNHFYIYTRDEFYSQQTQTDWSKKIDILSDIIVKPIPELNAAQLLFSYKKDKDWWNKYYDSLYGNITYGSLRIETGYEFAHNVKDVMSPMLFGPTPIVEYGPSSWPSETNIEIINSNIDLLPHSYDLPSNIIQAAGYFAANGTLTPYQTEPYSYQIQNGFSGTQFSKARVGVKISYWGNVYTITHVYNPWAFAVDQQLWRPITVPGESEPNHRVTDQLYATNDGFTYITDSTAPIPAIYDSSDNNATHKPVKTEMKILYMQNFSDGTNQGQWSQMVMQYTPYLVNGVFNYQNISGYYVEGSINFNSMPFCSHLDDPVNPTKDLLFGAPIALFFTFPYDGTGYPNATKIYPSTNLYSRFWINTVNEITDKDCKFVDCMLTLNSSDISNLELNAMIYINGTNYRINEVVDYSPNNSLTKVELIRVPKYTVTTPFPFVYCGPNVTIAGPTSYTMEGEVSPGGNDGEVIEVIEWTLLAGPSGNTSGVTFSDPTSPTATVSGMIVNGLYTFMLYALDNYGLSCSCEMTITVGSHVPCSPTAIASNTGPIVLPASEAELMGSGTGCNGSTIVSYAWSQISGGTAVIVSPSNQNSFVSGMTSSGNYVFLLTVTDNYADTGTTTTTIMVDPTATVEVQNTVNSATLNVTGINALTNEPGYSLPIVGDGNYFGTYSAFTGSISAELSGTFPSGEFYIVFSKNGVQYDCKDADSGDTTYTSISETFNGTDTIKVEFTLGRC